MEALQPLALKGKSEPVAAFRLMSVDLGAPGVARHLDTPLVGRDHELRVVREALAGYEAKEDRPETAEAQAFLDTL